MPRALKVFTYTAHSTKTARALGDRPHIAQVRCVVAAHSQKQAAALLGTTPTDLRTYGGTLEHDHPEAAEALASPGQVIARRLDDYGGRGPRIKAGVGPGERSIRPHVETDLDHAVALIAHDEAERAAAREATARREAEWAERSERQRQHVRQTEAFIEWAKPLLADLGIHPATVNVGKARPSHVGVLLPPEAVAMLIREVTGERYVPEDPT